MGTGRLVFVCTCVPVTCALSNAALFRRIKENMADCAEIIYSYSIKIL